MNRYDQLNELRDHVREDLSLLQESLEKASQWKQALCVHVRERILLILHEDSALDGYENFEVSLGMYNRYDIGYDDAVVNIFFFDDIEIGTDVLSSIRSAFDIDDITVSCCSDYLSVPCLKLSWGLVSPGTRQEGDRKGLHNIIINK